MILPIILSIGIYVLGFLIIGYTIGRSGDSLDGDAWVGVFFWPVILALAIIFSPFIGLYFLAKRIHKAGLNESQRSRH